MGYQNPDEELQSFLIDRHILSREDVYFAMNYRDRLPDNYKRSFRQILFDLDFMTEEELDYSLETHGFKLNEHGNLILMKGKEIPDVSILDDILDDPPNTVSPSSAPAEPPQDIELHVLEGGERKILSASEAESAEMLAAAMDFYEQQFLQDSGSTEVEAIANISHNQELAKELEAQDPPPEPPSETATDPSDAYAIPDSEAAALSMLFDDPVGLSPEPEATSDAEATTESEALAFLFDDPVSSPPAEPAPDTAPANKDALDLEALFNESPVPSAHDDPPQAADPPPTESPPILEPELSLADENHASTQQILVPRHTESSDVLQAPEARISDSGAFEVIVKEGGAERIMSASEEESAEMIEQAMKFYHQQFFANDMVASYNSKTHGDDEINAILMQFPDAMRAQAHASANQQPMGQILLTNDVIEEWQLVHALCMQQMGNKNRLGDILVQLNYATSERIEAALAQHQR